MHKGNTTTDLENNGFLCNRENEGAYLLFSESVVVSLFSHKFPQLATYGA